MRYQTVDGENPGKPITIKELALRLDYRRHDASSSPGRTFSSVTIQMSDGDLQNFGTDFSKNQTSAPTTVFQGAVTWPVTIGFPLTKPDVWGGTLGSFRFPFTTTWQFTGQNEVLTDWTFAGGTLSNSKPWNATDPHDYYFDSYGDPNTPKEGSYLSIPDVRLNNNSPGVTTRCNDSAWGALPTGAYSRIYGFIYSKWAANINYREKLVMYSTSYYTAPNAPVFHAWGFANDRVGFDVGTGCNRLHPAGPLFVQFFWAAPRSIYPNAYSGYAPLSWKWQPVFANARVTMQAGWADSVTGNFNLTQARQISLPASPPPPNAAKRSAIYQYSNLPVAGPIAEHYANPAFRYR